MTPELVKAEELGAKDDRQAEGQTQHNRGGLATEVFADMVVVGVHPEVPKTRDEVVQAGPDQAQHHQFPQEAGDAQHADVERGGEARK